MVLSELRAATLAIALLVCALASFWVAGPANAAHHEKEPAAADGVPIEKRQEIFRAINEARSRADRDAEKASIASPGSEAQSDLATKLTKEYEAKVAEKFGVTKRQVEQIIEEGYAKSWAATNSRTKGVKTSLP
jgi:hypothetical protein